MTCAAVLAFAALSFAAGPQWSTGFPKLAQKDALLQWNPVKGAAEYKVYRSEAGKAPKLIATVKANRYIDKGLAAGKSYGYIVAAVVAGAEGERSAEGKVQTVAEKVVVPLKTPRIAGAHIKDLPGGKASVGIRFEDYGGTNLVGINVYRSKSKGKDFVMVGSAAGDTYEDTDVVRGETYYYTATSVDNQFNETKRSNEYAVEVPTLKEAAKVEAAPATKETPPTEMRHASLVYQVTEFRKDIPDDKSEATALGGVQDVAVDEAAGNIYVSSWTKGSVFVLDLDGKARFIIRSDGANGTKPFVKPIGVALGPDGTLYVCTYEGGLVYAFDPEGRPKGTVEVRQSDYADDLARFGIPVRPPHLRDVAVNANGEMFVTDSANNCVHVYDSSGRYVLSIGRNMPHKQKENFNGVTSLALTKDGNMVFSDTGFNRLMVYVPDGRQAGTIGKSGSAAGEIDGPTGVAVGKDGVVYTASATNPNIQGFTEKGKFLFALCNDKGTGPLDVGEVRGIWVDGKDRIYLCEVMKGMLSVYQMGKETVNLTPQ